MHAFRSIAIRSTSVFPDNSMNTSTTRWSGSLAFTGRRHLLTRAYGRWMSSYERRTSSHRGGLMSAVARTSCSRRRFSRDSARLSSSAFHRVVQRSSPPSISPEQSSPTHRSVLRTSAAKRLSRAAFVVSHHPDGLLLLGIAGLLRPATDHEVHRVLCSVEHASPMPHPPEHSPPE
jgi:hypothetical protein